MHEGIACPVEMAVEPVFRLFNNNREQLAQNNFPKDTQVDLVPPTVGNQRGIPPTPKHRGMQPLPADMVTTSTTTSQPMAPSLQPTRNVALQ